MKRILLLAALALASAQPAYADGWTSWRQFAQHNGVILEWRTYSNNGEDTLADWRVTNRTNETLYNLALGTRHYSCSNQSRVFQMRSIVGGLELRPGDYVEIGDGGAANYIGADSFPRSECTSIVKAEFHDGVDRALEFAVGGPHEPVLPWTHHNFAADPSAPSSSTASMISCFYHDEFQCTDYIDPPDPSVVLQDCDERGGRLLSNSSCQKTQSYSCSLSSDLVGDYVVFIYDLRSWHEWLFRYLEDDFLDHFYNLEESWAEFCVGRGGTFLVYTE